MKSILFVYFQLSNKSSTKESPAAMLLSNPESSGIEGLLTRGSPDDYNNMDDFIEDIQKDEISLPEPITMLSPIQDHEEKPELLIEQASPEGV